LLNPLPTWHAATHRLLDLVFPRRCVACNRGTDLLCSSCQNEIELIEPPVCPLCGRSMPAPRRCLSCQRMPLRISGIRAVGYLDGPLRTAIHRFKYSNVRGLAAILGRLAVASLLRYDLPVDTIVPVPLHVRRLRERGYNQASLLAAEIGSATGLPVVDDVLVRVRSTIPQVGLTARSRRENVRGAFGCTSARLKGHHVLLVDDVCTTGATLEACSTALQEAASGPVWGLVLARERFQES
jgi:ComF family protein